MPETNQDQILNNDGEINKQQSENSSNIGKQTAKNNMKLFV